MLRKYRDDLQSISVPNAPNSSISEGRVRALTSEIDYLFREPAHCWWIGPQNLIANGGQENTGQSEKTWLQILALPLTSYGTLAKLPNLSKPQSSHV